jgi:hypothetical protein
MYIMRDLYSIVKYILTMTINYDANPLFCNENVIVQ